MKDLKTKKNFKSVIQIKGTIPQGEVKANWLGAWQRVASMKNGLIDDDPRRPAIERLIDSLDDDFLAHDVQQFAKHVAELQ